MRHGDKPHRRSEIIKYFDALRDLREASLYGYDARQHEEIVKVLKATAKHDRHLSKMDAQLLELILEHPDENEAFVDAIRDGERDG